jgi:tetratricopeptide (TPR) repeat protein
LLAAAHDLIGNVLQKQGKLAEAQGEFEQSLAISRRLAELDPSNVSWQHQLAVECAMVARLGSKVGTHSTALVLYEEASRIFNSLVKSVPESAQWAKEKEVVDSELAICRTKV